MASRVSGVRSQVPGFKVSIFKVSSFKGSGLKVSSFEFRVSGLRSIPSAKLISARRRGAGCLLEEDRRNGDFAIVVYVEVNL